MGRGLARQLAQILPLERQEHPRDSRGHDTAARRPNHRHRKSSSFIFSDLPLTPAPAPHRTPHHLQAIRAQMASHLPRRPRRLARLRDLLRRPIREESHNVQHEPDVVGAAERARDGRLPPLPHRRLAHRLRPARQDRRLLRRLAEDQEQHRGFHRGPLPAERHQGPRGLRGRAGDEPQGVCAREGAAGPGAGHGCVRAGHTSCYSTFYERSGFSLLHGMG